MTSSTLPNRLLLLGLSASLLVALVFGWALREAWAREDVPRAASVFQQPNTKLGLAQSQVALFQKALDAEYAAKVKDGALPDARPFLKAQHATVDAVLSADGKFPAIRSASGTLVQPELDFRITGAILKKGAIETAQLAVQKVDAAGKPIGDAQMENVKFDQAPPTPAPLFDPHLVAEIALLAPPRLPLQASPSFGLGASLLQWRGFGLQASAFVGLTHLEDSGGALALTWRPAPLGRTLNVALSVGAAVTVLGVVAPRVGVSFFVW